MIQRRQAPTGYNIRERRAWLRGYHDGLAGRPEGLSRKYSYVMHDGWKTGNEARQVNRQLELPIDEGGDARCP